jgi:FkbM family methyltransferase
VDFPNGTKLLVNPHMKGAAHFIYPGLSEFDDMAFVMHFLRPEDTFLDVGANVGAFTIMASGVIGARTTAYEPCPSTYSMLARNIRLNGIEGKAKAKNVALGRQRGKMRFTEDLGTENYILTGAVPTNIHSTEVEVSTLDEEVADSPPTLMKIDVEGYETEVFSSGRRTLASKSMLALIAERAGNGERYGFDEEKLHAEIRAEGFVPCRYDPFERKLKPAEEGASGNIIYIRDLGFAGERLAKAPQFRMAGLSF